MKTPKKALLVLTSAGMEITWRYAWSNFLTLVIIHQPFPLPLGLGAFGAAAFFTRLSSNRNWRRLQAAILHILGCTLAAVLLIHRLFFKETALFNGAWVTELIRQLKFPQQWFILLPIIFCLLLFWLGGRTSEKTPRDYLSVCLQFDKGLGAFFLIFLIKFLAQEKGGLHLEDPISRLLVIAFFLFGLLSIGLAREQSDAKKSFLAGYHGIGIILGFAVVSVLCGAALILLTFPYLTHMADSANLVLKEAAAPLGPIIVSILRFIFARSKYQIETGGSATTTAGVNDALPASTGGWEEYLLSAIGWGLIGILGLAAIGLSGYLICYIIRWLLKRPSQGGASLQSVNWLSKLLFLLVALPRNIWGRVMYSFRSADGAVSVYARILRWGRRSGLQPVASETPGEYGRRLKHQFPELEKEIEIIIEAVNREVYGEIATGEQTLYSICSALGRMRSLRHWPSRISGWFVQPPPEGLSLYAKSLKADSAESSTSIVKQQKQVRKIFEVFF